MEFLYQNFYLSSAVYGYIEYSCRSRLPLDYAVLKGPGKRGLAAVYFTIYLCSPEVIGPSLVIIKFSAWIQHANCMSFDCIVTYLVCMAHRFLSSKGQTNCNLKSHVCILISTSISLIRHWSGLLL